ncbi:MAG TPA: TIGR01777 family oxidoreductase, partial [Chthoniobacterales bacterium]|nr:TIGR01777 family oxidoreductase [Chthoniobacterales bacterium]
ILADDSGFLGQDLTRFLVGKGYSVVILARRATMRGSSIRSIEWDGRTRGSWMRYLSGAKAVVNLAGKSVNCLHNERNRREILNSRLDSVRILGEAVRSADRPPQAFIQATSLEIYGNTAERINDEYAPPGSGFLAEACQRWEELMHEIDLPASRRIILRMGLALGPGNSALAALAQLTKSYLGGSIGSGNQYISWIHVDDLNEMVRWSIERPDVQGIYSATSPNPVTNREFMRELRLALNRPWSPPIPVFAVKLGAKFISRTEASLALTGRRCIPRRFLQQGFEFQQPELAQALRDVLAR